jgi:hypothetical protein
MEVIMLSTIWFQQGRENDLGWLLYLLLVVLLVIVILVWLARRKAAPRPEIIQEAQVPINAVDDLTRIEGIGPTVQKVLNEAGIQTFASLADADPSQVQNTLRNAGLQMMDPTGWIEQARLAAREDWAELKNLQKQLKGGRRQ